jgi:hypothetical protein
MNAFPKAVSATAVSRGDGGGANYQIKTEDGMTLRDYFAAKAMQGVVASSTYTLEVDTNLCSKWAYEMADKMMEARNVAQ